MSTIHAPVSFPEPPSITMEELAQGLNAQSNYLILDARAYPSFVLGHITSAINLPPSNLMMRRLAQGKTTVLDLLSDAFKPVFTKLADEALIVVYDDKTYPERDFENKMKIINSLRSAGHRTALLTSAFADFAATYPELIEVEDAMVAPLAIPSMVPCELRLDSPAKVKITNLEPTQILPCLYIGAKKDALNIEKLKSLGIKSVVNVTKDCPNAFEDQINYLQIPVDDQWSQDLMCHFDKACEFIDRYRKLNQPVLVHCLAGISRSPSITIAYVMRDQKLSLNDALNFVKSKRPAIAPHLDFLGELISYENRYPPVTPAPQEASAFGDMARKHNEELHHFAASSILSESCPWLKQSLNTTPDPSLTSMDVDSEPPTPGPAGSRAPWAAEFNTAKEDTTLQRQVSSSSSDQSTATVEMLVPCIVLAPVPRLKGRVTRTSSSAVTPVNSARVSPPSVDESTTLFTAGLATAELSIS